VMNHHSFWTSQGVKKMKANVPLPSNSVTSCFAAQALAMTTG
jgi:hypothetical protein